MTCKTIDLGGGATAIVCTRGRKAAPCEFCRERPHTLLCDYPLAGKRKGATCSKRMCQRCATSNALAGDLCPPHARSALGAER